MVFFIRLETIEKSIDILGYTESFPYGMIGITAIQGSDIMFGRKKKQKDTAYAFDPARQKAVLRCSICTGEQVVGFKDLDTGKFEEIMLIKNKGDLEAFKARYGVTEITKEY